MITHMVAGRSHLQEKHTHPGYVLNSLLKDLAQTIVHNILFPATSEFMRPSLPPRVATAEFWHAQLNYAVLRAEAALVTRGSAEGIAGDQLCQWNTIASNAIIPSTHLTLFLPPSLGAYVMANHQSHRDFKPQPSSSTNDIPTFTVQQWLHFPLPEVLSNQVEHLNMARYAAADGYITPAAIPFLSFFLAQPNERLSIVGHLDTSAIKIKKMPPAHAKHRTKHKQTNTNNHHPTQQRNGTCSRQSEKGETVRHPKRPQWSNSCKKPHSSAAQTQPP